MTKHGLSKHPLHKIWRGILARCKNKTKKYYGYIGVKVCTEWFNDFVVFYHWAIKNNWKADLDIDRIDNNGDYSPDNCRFVTRSENLKNRRPYSATGIKYVYKNKNFYQVRKKVDDKLRYYGNFKSLEKAKNVADKIA